ncbi:kelch domain-containing protein 2-like [Oncorhynchus keta]|uniref:kelch domain-containing protein 2-like n=1 Tax=Oncorhynchus keta TaxID=8018 RepID=UPI00227D647E|nr:kelch domain-containing protein 2-like [Oncorhynchus keta]
MAGGNLHAAMSGSCGVCVDGVLYLFGGHHARGNTNRGDNPGWGWNNHIHILDLEMFTWSQPVTKGNAPSPRAAHACAKVGNRGYVFGGRYRDYRLNDLHYIDMGSGMKCSPHPKCLHACYSIKHLFLGEGAVL